MKLIRTLIDSTLLLTPTLLQAVTDGFRYEDTQNHRTCVIMEKLSPAKQNMFLTVDLGSALPLHSVSTFGPHWDRSHEPLTQGARITLSLTPNVHT